MDDGPVTDDLGDRHLAERGGHGDRAAQREVYDRTSERIYRLVLKITRNADQAFDLTQQTYVRAFAHMHQFDGRASLSTWLYRIAVNEALQAARREATASAKLREIRHSAAEGSATEQITMKIDVAEALEALSAEERTILLLRYQDGLDYGAIAEVTGCPSGTVASRLNRAREKLRGLLASGYGAREENALAKHQNDEGSAAFAEQEQATRRVPDGPE
jgi:RNA polymerase sigma-70 factor, ECF subfamily